MTLDGQNLIDARRTNTPAPCVLVTGGVGFVGSHLVEQLLAEGVRTVIFDKFNAETTPIGEKSRNAQLLLQKAAQAGRELAIYRGDLCNEADLAAVLDREPVTACLHVGGMVDDRRSVRFAHEYIEANVKGTQTLLDLLGRRGIRQVVQASTRSVFGERSDPNTWLDESAPRRPINPYGATKVATDALAHVYSKLFGLSVTLIRVFAGYGPRGRGDMIPRILIESLHRGLPIRKYGDGSATRDWIYISDIVAAFLLAWRNPQPGFREYNIGNGLPVSLNELIERAASVVGRDPVIENVPAPPGDAGIVGLADTRKIRHELGWQPRVGLVTGLQRTYEWLLGEAELHRPTTTPDFSGSELVGVVRESDNGLETSEFSA